MHIPPLLSTGARVALVSPSGPIRMDAEMDRAIENAKLLGWEPVVSTHARETRAYLAGSDDQRAADLNWAARDPSINGVWCVRGGYGAMRVLEQLDYQAWCDNPKTLMGYSDITALHAAIGRRAEFVTYHAPTARSVLTPFSLDSFQRAVVRGEDSCGVAPAGRTLVGGSVRGRLMGGNLALLSALSGTPYAPNMDDAILVVEDVNESVYRIDRMLTQLRLSGVLGRCAGIVFGGFTEIPSEATDAERGIDDVLREIAEAIGVPCMSHAPIGHIEDQWTVPLGAIATLDAGALRLTVSR